MPEIENNNPETVTIPTEQLEELLRQNEKLKERQALLKFGVLQICGVLGLTNQERTQLKPEVANGEEGVFKNLLKAGADLFGLFAKSSVPGRIGRNAEEEIKKQGEKLKDTVKIGHESIGLARSAMLALRGQRDQIINTVELVREMGGDLVRSDKMIKDINRRKLFNILVLYLIIILLFFTNCLVLWFKLSK